MKFFTLFLLISLFSLVACQKDEDKVEPEIPNWVDSKAEEIFQDLPCGLTEITRISYDGKYYYHFYSGLMSCIYCHLFDENGDKISWGENFDFNDFAENKSEETIGWNCSN